MHDDDDKPKPTFADAIDEILAATLKLIDKARVTPDVAVNVASQMYYDINGLGEKEDKGFE